MKTIWKYELHVVDMISLQMPKGAEVLTVQTQFGSTVMWAMVDTTNEKEMRHFEIYGTGNPIPKCSPNKQRVYIGTFQLEAGRLVFHLFETTPFQYSI